MCSGVQIAPFFNLVPNFFLKSILYYLKKYFSLKVFVLQISKELRKVIFLIKHKMFSFFVNLLIMTRKIQIQQQRP